MAENPRIRVPGYAQRVFFNDGIEYRNFSDSLVGNQLTDEGGLPLFTMGNFTVTTNLDPSVSITHNTGGYGPFYDLSTLDVTDSETALLLNDNATARLNLDDSNLLNHAYFGSLTEFVRVNLEEIITNWVASIYMTPIVTLPNGLETTGYTVTNYLYDANTNTSTFNVPYQTIINNYEINYLVEGSIVNTFNEGNDLRNMTVNYLSYSVLLDNLEYDVLAFTGLTNSDSGSLSFQVEGDPFALSANSANQFVKYHIKPNKVEEDKFFNNLPDFQKSLLNTIVKPKYTITFRYPVESDDGIILYQTTKLKWTTTDGYNLDFNTPEYTEYVNQLIELSELTDLSKSDLIVRFLTADSISEFDTIPQCDGSEDETAAQKVTKTLRVYGREFDDIKRYIDGIAFANVVTYNKRDNTPDLVLKNLARVMGWDLVSSILENNLLANYVTTPRASFSGQSRGLTPIESEYEMWRRLIMNTPWIWKSKGQRKVIEFLTQFIGAPDGLMEFNEHVYVASAPLDIDLFREVLRLNNLDTDLSLYNIDEDGFPIVRPDNRDMYFQKGGGWYRETGGANAGKYILDGNNPHSGPYDRGQEFINQFRGLIPDFEPVTVTATTTETGTQTLFTNYNQGLVNNYTGNTYVDVSADGYDVSNCIVIDSYVIEDPNPTDEVNDCGCDIATNDDSIQIDIAFTGNTVDPCPTLYANGYPNTPDGFSGVTSNGFYVFQYPLYDIDGVTPNVLYPFYNSPFIRPDCCSGTTGDGYSMDYTDLTIYDDESQPQPTLPSEIIGLGYVPYTQNGSICCRVTNGVYVDDCICFATCNWRLTGTTFNDYTVSIGGETYLHFVDPQGGDRVVSPDGCNCIHPSVATSGVIDPFTGEEGFGCKLDINDWGETHLMTTSYKDRLDRIIGCTEDNFLTPETLPE